MFKNSSERRAPRCGVDCLGANGGESFLAQFAEAAFPTILRVEFPCGLAAVSTFSIDTVGHRWCRVSFDVSLNG